MSCFVFGVSCFDLYRLNVTFSNGAKSYNVPGYYAADGNAGETSATGGNKWKVHFCPDETGTWNYTASFRQGGNIALDLNDGAHRIDDRHTDHPVVDVVERALVPPAVAVVDRHDHLRTVSTDRRCQVASQLDRRLEQAITVVEELHDVEIVVAPPFTALAAAAAIGVMTPWIKRIMAEHEDRSVARMTANAEAAGEADEPRAR